jgi:hypothetical protein
MYSLVPLTKLKNIKSQSSSPTAGNPSLFLCVDEQKCVRRVVESKSSFILAKNNCFGECFVILWAAKGEVGAQRSCAPIELRRYDEREAPTETKQSCGGDLMKFSAPLGERWRWVYIACAPLHRESVAPTQSSARRQEAAQLPIFHRLYIFKLIPHTLCITAIGIDLFIDRAAQLRRYFW